jgi:predicted RNA binding protein YcfA (HicA-like mRNA interferase family)
MRRSVSEKKQKLINRLKCIPKDFSFTEMENLLKMMGFNKSNKGKTSGSSTQFYKNHTTINIHKPHPRKELLEYQIKQIIEILERENLI